MICKECGAYNPDHATYCKVCAANLKGETAPETAEVPEEEQQPTKRFSRPSWIVPEQTEQVKETVEETVQDAEESVQAPVEEVKEDIRSAEEEVNEAVSQKEEPVVPLWTPSRSHRNKVVEPEETEEEPVLNDEDEEEGIYNDEEALEDDEDSFEYEPTPPKRKQQKKKNNTLFTVLLIAIIVVIVGILVLGGYMLLRKQLKCTKTPDKAPDASQTDTQVEPGDKTPEVPADNQPETTEAPALDAKNAQLLEFIDEKNADMIAITVVVPANSKVTIDFPNQADYEYVNSEAKDVTRKVKIPVEVFYLNQPLEDATVEFHPDITVTEQDGSSYKVNCDSFTRTFPKLNITLTAPVPGEDGMIMAPESNVISLTGTIDDPGSEITVNGIGVTVYTGGVFMYDYKFADDATEDTEDTITIVAKKNDCVSDTKEITVHAYKFIPEPMVLEVKSEGAALRADKTGKLTVTGKTLPGATLIAASDNSTNVLCGSVNVDGEGNFSFQITMDPAFYGMSSITLNATKEGAESDNKSFTVTRGFADKEAFLKYYRKTKTYMEVPKNIKIEELLANQAQYATNTYGIRITATVVEVITIDGDTIVKMTMNKSGETVYVHNLSDKWTPAENVGAKYNVYGNFVGTYSDTGCCEFLGWFAKKP